jgi:cell division protein FtsW
MFIVSRLNPAFWEKIALPLFIGSLLLLIVVLIPGIGTKVLGARRWIILGPISIQPSEVVKLALAIYLAKVAAKGKGILSYFLPLAAVAALVMMEPDLGTTLVIMALALSQIFVAGVNLFQFLGFLLLGGGISAIYVWLSDYRRNRLLTFLAQSQDPLGRDYHIRQILLALGSGGLFGVGLGEGRQKFLFLPEAATDSIFAVIAEEVGFIGALVVIIIFAVFIFRALKVSVQAENIFSKILGIGIVAWIGGQAILNIGSMVALTPLTGVPLPFFSYGGSALTMILVACGILLSISKYSHERK